jgi:Cys-tRNA(Pro)/Cys-tRNA(Cys) deacylase
MCGIFPIMTVSTPATLALDQVGIAYRLFQHKQPPGSLEQAARARGQEPGQIIRSIVFRKGEGDYFMVLMAGPGQISWRKLRLQLGVSRISLASADEVLTATGYAIGAVSPFGSQHPLRTLADESVFRPEEVSFGSGRGGVAILIKSADLRQALGEIEVGDFTD